MFLPGTVLRELLLADMKNLSKSSLAGSKTVKISIFIDDNIFNQDTELLLYYINIIKIGFLLDLIGKYMPKQRMNSACRFPTAEQVCARERQEWSIDNTNSGY